MNDKATSSVHSTLNPDKTSNPDGENISPVIVRYFEKGSGFTDASLEFSNGFLYLKGNEGRPKKHIDIKNARLDTLVAGIPARLYLQDGCLIESDTSIELEKLFALANGHDITKMGRKYEVRFHGLKPRQWGMLILAIIFLPVFLWFSYPPATDVIGRVLPYQTLNKPSQTIMEELEERALKPTSLTLKRQRALQQGFQEFVAFMDIEAVTFHLHFRSSEYMGPNAFALPDGTVVLLDELVELAENDEEILAVLAHELGHIHHKHGIRNYVRSTGLTFLFYFFIADSSGFFDELASMALGLVQLSYSREFELEADEYSAKLMRHFDMHPSHLIELLERIGVDEKSYFFSSHPGLRDRLKSTLKDSQ